MLILIPGGRPPDPFIKLNTDGSALGNPGLAGAGGLLRNNSGDGAVLRL